ncbi:3-dehydroquinate synthase [Puniceicoccaceae bacterium K14]|nr:3-dehydroquinate synthase [Puniceicoccaceae bacterium K14]
MSSAIRINVETAATAYPIHIGYNLQSTLSSEIEAITQTGARVAVVTDETVRGACQELFSNVLSEFPCFVVSAGEPSKCIENFGKVIDFLAEEKLDRGGVLIAVGGGVVGDLAGFAASSYLRGIRFVQVPTTLLAMVDSSVGGKTGINISAGKNLLGAFHQPISVYADMQVLDSLAPREFAAGMAEVIKYGLLADEGLYRELEAKPLVSSKDERLPEIVRRCCQIKADVVKADEKETAKLGGRALLNLGHTFGHAIENIAGYGEYLHGEAIGIGMAAAARLSRELGYISEEDVASVEKTVEAHKLPIRLSKSLEIPALYEAMGRDKKMKSGFLKFVAMKSLGVALTTSEAIDRAILDRVWTEVGASNA